MENNKNKTLKTNNLKLQANKGQAALTAVLFFIFIALALIGGFAILAGGELQNAKTIEKSKQSYFFAEGAVEDALYRLISGKNMPGVVFYQEGTLTATTTVTADADTTTVETIGAQIDAWRKIKSALLESSGAAFNYGLQTGNGGFLMENTSKVTGNIYANGAIEGRNSNLVQGTIVSVGPDGVIDGVHATGTAYAHIIQNSTVDGDAYYQIISDTTVAGAEFPDSPDQPALPLPISDGTIAEWEQAAESGGIIDCSDKYVIDDDIVLGPVKIACKLEIKGDPVITLGGMVWVYDLDIQNSAVIRLDPSLGRRSVAIIADNPDNRLTAGKIVIQNSVQFQNSGVDGSYVMLVSQNSSAENGGNERAVEFKNTASGDVLLYAAHGEVLMDNNNDLREITAYRVHLKNAAHVIYETGLVNLLFKSGPAGGWQIDNWQETL